jgi:hypothetical protein
MKKVLSVVLVGVFLVGTAAVAVAQEASPSPSPTDANRQERVRRLREGRAEKPARGFLVLHSDGVGMRRDGTTVEFRTQKGIIKEVSATSITIESPDKYVQTYKIDGDTVVREKRQPSSAEDLKAGEMAQVRAEKVGNDYLAKLINCTGEPGPRLKELLERTGG